MSGRLTESAMKSLQISQEVSYLQFLTKSIGCAALGLTPDVQAEGKTFNFMGIYAKNREEWVLTDIANVKNSVITVAFYDTLGPDAVRFVINQTGLTAISCSANYLPSLIKLKKDNAVQTL